MPEQRQHQRTAFRAHVKLMHPEAGEHNVEMRDMSDGGLFLLSTNLHSLPVGTVVHVQALEIADAPVLAAQVVRHDPAGIGLKFISE